jgi:hypothetical protein
MAINAGSISLNPSGSGSTGPYTTGASAPKPGASTGQPRSFFGGGTPSAPSNVVQSQAVRATGSGPYDNAYRQDLATYAGGLASRPGGSLSFDPTGNLFGSPSGGGNAPVLGGPTDLLSSALGGQAVTAQPPSQAQQAQPVQPTNNAQDYWKFWLNGYNNLGANLRGANTF